MKQLQRTTQPTVLVIATDRWFPTARLAMALANAGFAVEACCPTGHPISRTRAANYIHDYNGLMPLTSIRRAIETADPHLLVPADDLATKHLHDLYQGEQRQGASAICNLIETSLGSADSFELLRSRNAFMQLAREEGIRAPRTQVIQNRSDLERWMSRTGYPFVLKANGTSGGDGVSVVNTAQEAESAFRTLQAPPYWARAVKHALLDRDLTLVAPSLFRRRRVVNAQEFVSGREATSTIACWKGTILASLHFEVVEKVKATGHASVVRLMEHPQMSIAADKVARRLQLSGVHGLDFMLEARTGDACLIEINPRTTQVAHLALGLTRNLPAALYSAVTSGKIDSTKSVTTEETVALFPQEWKRDPASAYLLSAYHDVPWEEPGLLAACIRSVETARGKVALAAKPAQVVTRANAIVSNQTISSSAAD